MYHCLSNGDRQKQFRYSDTYIPFFLKCDPMIKPSAPLYLCTLFIVTPDPTSTGTSIFFFTSTKCI